MIPSYRCSDLPLVGEPLYPCSRSVHAYVPYGTDTAGYSWEYYAVCGIPRMHPWFSLLFSFFHSFNCFNLYPFICKSHWWPQWFVYISRYLACRPLICPYQIVKMTLFWKIDQENECISDGGTANLLLYPYRNSVPVMSVRNLRNGSWPLW
ncbi:hypothetical protein BDV40DRAFT_283212 [Aspergillus tamarii]|uniref:Uncharacterized protein n=1 Tax=Aspergillus tamarii TaxID=41984 RepID=A0A5N6UAW3_ASPTM|nr:hypothetical protein BDV40DRAFT_283212 [Aspergillus tamarii]